MHNAPSVTYPVGRSDFFALLLGAIWLLGAALVGWWCLQADGIGWRQWLALLSLPASAGAAFSSWRAMRPGEVRWDGQQWLWLVPGAEPRLARLSVHLDTQRQLLLRLQPEDSAPAWCWAARTRQPERWGDLRRAVYSPARSQAVSDDAPVLPASPET